MIRTTHSDENSITNLKVRHVMKDIILFRCDLRRGDESLPFEDVTYNNFKSSILSRDEIGKSRSIEFIDGNKSKMLKYRGC